MKSQKLKRRVSREDVKTLADANARDIRGRTPLHYAVKADDKVVVELIKAGADVNARDGDGRTPLHWAVVARENAETLLYYGADPTAKNAEGKTPVDMAGEQYEKYRSYCYSPSSCWTWHREIEECAATLRALAATEQQFQW